MYNIYNSERITQLLLNIDEDRFYFLINRYEAKNMDFLKLISSTNIMYNILIFVAKSLQYL